MGSWRAWKGEMRRGNVPAPRWLAEGTAAERVKAANETRLPLVLSAICRKPPEWKTNIRLANEARRAIHVWGLAAAKRVALAMLAECVPKGKPVRSVPMAYGLRYPDPALLRDDGER